MPFWGWDRENRWGAIGEEGREVAGVGWLDSVGCCRTLALILTENREPLKSSEQRRNLIGFIF